MTAACCEASVDVRIIPAKDGTIGTYTHNVFPVRADFHVGDAATVANPNKGHFTLIIVPHFH